VQNRSFCVGSADWASRFRVGNGLFQGPWGNCHRFADKLTGICFGHFAGADCRVAAGIGLFYDGQLRSSGSAGTAERCELPGT